MKHPTRKVAEPDETEDSARSAVDIMQDSQDLYERKNDDYGDSWKLAGKTMTMWFQHQGINQINIPVNEYTMTSFQLFTRRLDKMIRAFNGWFCLGEGEEFQVDEGIVETQGDQVPYAAMHTQLAEEYANADPEEFLP